MNKPRGQPFQPGNKLARGRPPGSRNKNKSPEQNLLDEYAPHLVRKCIALALQGDRRAMTLCMERISPPRRDGYLRMNLPTICQAQDVDKAAEKVTQALRRGTITPAEGGKVMNILEGHLRIKENVQLENRIQQLEAKVIGDKAGPRAA